MCVKNYKMAYLRAQTIQTLHAGDYNYIMHANNPSEIIEESKNRMRDILSQMLTPEVKSACPGVAIIMISVDEYRTLMLLLGKVLKEK